MLNKNIVGVLIVLIVFCMFGPIEAVSYEDYPLGCYSFICNNDTQEAYNSAEIDQILSMIDTLGYNIV